MKLKLLFVLLACALPVISHASEQCKENTVDKHKVKICRQEGGLFKHDHYSLTVDGELIFKLIDDYAEDVSLKHKTIEGPALEMPLSANKEPYVTISGGCVSVSKKDKLGGKEIDIEVGRKCNFTWGAIRIVENVEFKID